VSRTRDAETCDRLLDVAARLFAARGFKDVTIREICRSARANVAAVNYHFGDKLGLYREVLNKAIETMQATTEAARQAGTGLEAEQKLRAYIRVFLERTAAQSGDSWIHQLMLREMADPTPAIELVFEQVIRPRVAYLSEIVAEVLEIDTGDVQVLRSVMSIQSQCHAAMPNPLSKRLMRNLAADVTFDDLAEHIAQFSLGGLTAVARQTT
jgi:TetR/AcrR family transcriptional regulator, regulator of cefoperazone and chloramphenicol sensitivity